MHEARRDSYLPGGKHSIVLLSVALFGVFFAWLFYPPFPPVDALTHRSYSSIVNELGPPSDIMVEKSILWSVERGGLVEWVLDIGVDWSDDPQLGFSPLAEPDEVCRELWLFFPEGRRRLSSQCRIKAENDEYTSTLYLF